MGFFVETLWKHSNTSSKAENLTTVPEANTSVQEAAKKRLRSLKMIEIGNYGHPWWFSVTRFEYNGA